jgi:hypothetical protein
LFDRINEQSKDIVILDFLEEDCQEEEDTLVDS